MLLVNFRNRRAEHVQKITLTLNSCAYQSSTVAAVRVVYHHLLVLEPKILLLTLTVRHDRIETVALAVVVEIAYTYLTTIDHYVQRSNCMDL